MPREACWCGVKGANRKATSRCTAAGCSFVRDASPIPAIWFKRRCHFSNLIGYADAVRSLTHGEAALSMEFARYKPLDEYEYEEIQRKALGF